MAEIERQLELESDDGRPQRVRIVEKLIAMAREGEVRAMDLLLKRVAPERLAVENEDGAPLLIIRNFTGREHEIQRPGDSVIDVTPGRETRPGPGQAIRSRVLPAGDGHRSRGVTEGEDGPRDRGATEGDPERPSEPEIRRTADPKTGKVEVVL